MSRTRIGAAFEPVAATDAMSCDELFESGRAARTIVPLADQADWSPSAKRDPVAVLERSDADRLADLIPIRYQRMSVSSFAFLRGSVSVMADDLAHTPATGLRVQLCGDAHVANFGVFATAERRVVFDVNDFDETVPGSFEWDVKRLAASCVVAGRSQGMDTTATGLAEAALRAYCDKIAELAARSTLDVWYSTIDVDALIADPATWHTSKAVARKLAGTATRTNLTAFDRLTIEVHGRRMIADDPPLIEHCHDAEELGRLRAFHDHYRSTLPPDRRVLLDRFEFVDAARKTVGVGSVGTRSYLVLLEAAADREPLFLQVKQALPPALQPHVDAKPVMNNAARVVVGQRLLQSATDPMLGWARDGEIDLYVRQLWDRKGGLDLGGIGIRVLSRYSQLCGAALARAHARSSHPSQIAGYIGKGRAFTKAVTAYAVAYATQTEQDHAALVEAIADDRLATARAR